MAIPSDRLRKRIVAEFGGQVGLHVINDLLGIPESLPGGDRQDAERLQACAVIPAHGDYARFQVRVKLLRLDWRDALMSTGLEHENWSKELDRLLDL